MPVSAGKRKREVVECQEPNTKRVNREATETGTEGVEDDIVDTVNALPISEFTSRYVPQDVLELKIPISVPVSNGASDQTVERKEMEMANETKPAKLDHGHKIMYSTFVYSSADIPTRYYDACFNLIHKTSYAAYRASSVGWSARKKRDEMLLDDMRYLLLLRDPIPDANGEDGEDQSRGMESQEEGKNSTRKTARAKRPVHKDSDTDGHLPSLGGFISFMTTYEDDLPVLYLYEIHLHPSLQNQGIGKTLMTTLEDIARNIGGLRKTMLTVFRSNEAGRRFYERLGYGVDESSPEPRVLRGGLVRECNYLILSKELIPVEKAQQDEG